MTLDRDTRDAIGRTVRTLRELFEDEFGKQASGRFGIRSSRRTDAADADGLDAWLDPLESLSLTPAEFAQRDELVHALHYLTSEGNQPSEAVSRLIREAAFTAVNRLLAVRVAEAIGILPAVLSAGRQSAGFREAIGDLFPDLANDENAYWTYLQVSGDELAPGVPRLFDRRYPTSAFVPSRACVDEALTLLTAAELAGAWIEPETLGWSYQFFNGDDVKQMRDLSATPRNSRELAVRNQFFTPRYVVDWLVQNTLGRRLVQAGYDLKLPLLVGESDGHEPLALDDVRVLDPAVGSGHFLLGAYDLLEQAWASTGIGPSESAARVLPCLFGIDIDPRAAQVAQAVLLLRAKRSAPDATLSPPTVVAARALPHSEDLREEAFGSLSPAARELAHVIANSLDLAPLLGSLLRVEKQLESELSSQRRAPRLGPDGDESQVLAELHGALNELVSGHASPEQLMFTADASDALQFLEVCQGRYDAVLMNPPFGASPAEVNTFLRANLPEGKNDLYSAFVMRGHELLAPLGSLGALTNRTGFFLSSFEEWRVWLLDHGLATVADLGSFVLEDAQVEVAAYVVRRGYQEQTSFINLLHSSNKPRDLFDGSSNVVSIERDRLRDSPGAIFAYWLGAELLSLFADLPTATSSGIEVSRGLSTGDNFRFMRLAWEIPPSFYETGWKPLVKGGEFARYWASPHLALDWRDPERYSDVKGARIFNLQDQGRRGVFWTKRTTLLVSSRALPDGVWFEANSIPAFSKDTDPYLLLSWTNSRVFTVMFLAQMGAGDLARGSAAKDWISGPARRIPWAEPAEAEAEKLIALAQRATRLMRQIEARREPSPLFRRPAIAFATEESFPDRVRTAALNELSVEAELMVVHDEAQRVWEREVYGLGDVSVGIIDDWTEALVTGGDHHISLSLAVRAREAIALTSPIELEATPGDRRIRDRAAKQSSPRSLEDVSRVFGVRPDSLIDAWRSQGFETWKARDHAADLLSFLIGLDFGRWVDGEESPSAEGRTDDFAAMAASDWLGLERHSDAGHGRLLVDDPGSDRDIVTAIYRRALSMPEVGSDGLAWMENHLGDMRALLRGGFYAAHLARYSRSRRQAPVYWYLAVPSRDWGVWFLYHALDREMLYGIERAARVKRNATQSLCDQLSKRLSSGSEARDSRERLERAEVLAEQLQSYALTARSVAESGWSPDFSDGAVLNAAPLEPLIADTTWRREVAKHRKAMQKGDYPWATVQREYFAKRR